MADRNNTQAAQQLEALQAQAQEYTLLSLDHMARHGIQPEGRVDLFS